MKRVFLCLCLAAAVVFTVCGCGGSSEGESAEKAETVKEQVFYASFEVPAGWYSKTVRPYPSVEKSYEYKDGPWYSVAFVQADGSGTLEKELEEASSPFYPVPENMKDAITVERKDIELGDVSGRQFICTLKADGDVLETDRLLIVTGVETGEGFYLIKGQRITPGKGQKNYDRLLNSLRITEKMDEEIYAADVGQAGNYIFSLPGWTHRRETSTGLIDYSVKKTDLYLIPMKDGETTAQAVDRGYKDELIADADKVWFKELKKKQTDVGTVVRLKASKKTESGDQGKTEGDYILNTAKDAQGKDVCVLLSGYDKKKGKFQFPELLNSFWNVK